MPTSGRCVFVITGPSGVGKGTLIRELRKRLPQIALSVSATTRPPRAGERDRVDYYFMSEEEFERRVAAGEFVEHVRYAGASYGTLRSELEASLKKGRPVVLEIEVQGARQIRSTLPDATLIFIAPPSFEVLEERLRKRGTDSEEKIAQRLAVAREELAAKDQFEHVIENRDLAQAVAELEEVVRRHCPLLAKAAATATLS